MMDYRFPSSKRRRIMGLHIAATVGAFGAAGYLMLELSNRNPGLLSYVMALLIVCLLVLAVALVYLLWAFGRLRYRLSDHSLHIQAGGFAATLPLAETMLSKLERLGTQRETLTPFAWAFWTHYPWPKRPLAVVYKEHYCLVSPKESKQFRALYYRVQKIEATERASLSLPEEQEVRVHFTWRLDRLWAGESIWRRLGAVNMVLWLMLGAGVMAALDRLPNYTVLEYRLGRGILREGWSAELLWLWGLLGVVGVLLWMLGLFLRQRERFAAQLLLLSYAGFVLLAAVYLVTLLLFVG